MRARHPDFEQFPWAATSTVDVYRDDDGTVFPSVHTRHLTTRRRANVQWPAKTRRRVKARGSGGSGTLLARVAVMAITTNNPAPHAGEKEAPAIPKDGQTPGMGAAPTDTDREPGTRPDG